MKIKDLRYRKAVQHINKRYGALLSHCEEMKKAAKEICDKENPLPTLEEILSKSREKVLNSRVS